jgi:hypothetical protein
VTDRITAVFELVTERAVLLFSVVKSVFKVSSFDVNVPKAEIARFVFSTFLVICDCATEVSALTNPVTKLFRLMPEPDWLTLDMISLPVVVVPDVELPVLAT